MTSRAMEIAEREAAEAEVEAPDDGDGDDGDTDTADAPDTRTVTVGEAMPPQEPSERDIDTMFGKLDKYREQHGERVAKIIAVAPNLFVPCELCQTIGYRFTIPPSEIPEQLKEAVRAAIGDATDDGLEPAEGVAECDRCKGRGQLRFPTKNPHVATQACVKCQGQGYVTLPPPAPEAPPAFAAAHWSQPPPTTTNGPGVPDSWQRPPGHPHYGMPPASVGA